ncbi:hypothetical protein V5735_24220 (plasmid) [Haladaptatus sp. SPP-AMP-3]|uniref:hypothetical protein n=1 Tax=Haladaptatus sp. SPP-AMP-3 TaxID=3121295 RepID=UPI003C2ADAD0
MSGELSREPEQHRSVIYKDDSLSSTVKNWILLDGNRLVVTGLIGLSVFVVLYGLWEAGIISFQNSSAITRLSSGLIAGEFSLLTIVLAINQLILSQEMGPAGKILERLDGMMEFRHRFERVADVDVTPPEPVEMLNALAHSTMSEVDRLESTTTGIENSNLKNLISSYCTLTKESIANIQKILDESKPGAFSALSGAISENYGWQAHLAREIQAKYGDHLSEESLDSLESIIELMKVFSIARTHFKTIYIRRELGSASRYFLLIGIPGVLSAYVLSAIYGGSTGVLISKSLVSPVAIVLITISTLPIALLASYILRTATVARRTANIGPMVLQKEPKLESIDE